MWYTSELAISSLLVFGDENFNATMKYVKSCLLYVQHIAYSPVPIHHKIHDKMRTPCKIFGLYYCYINFIVDQYNDVYC